jgi:hypothetical protein
MRSSSVTLNVVRERSVSSTSGWRSLVRRSCARRARRSRRSHPFAFASPSASAGSSRAIDASARRRSRSVGASSIGHVSSESRRRVVARSTSSRGKSACTSSQNGLASLGLPSSVADSRTR